MAYCSFVFLCNGHGQRQLCRLACPALARGLAQAQGLNGGNGLRGCKLFGGATAGTCCRHFNIKSRNRALDIEHLIMCCAVRGNNGIRGQVEFTTLQEFLQKRLGILTQGFWIDTLNDGCVELYDSTLRSLEAGVKEDGSEDRLEGIGQNRWPPEAAAFQLTFAQTKILRQR